LAGSDKMTPPKKGRALAQAIAGSQLVEIAGAGHMLPSESPDEVNSALAGFFNCACLTLSVTILYVGLAAVFVNIIQGRV
jgi:hypothetical protein